MKSKYYLYALSILLLTSFVINAQNIDSYSRTKLFKFGICSPYNHSLNSTITYYNKHNKDVTTTIGLDFAMSAYKKENDSIKMVVIISPNYFLKILKIDYNSVRQIDNVYLQKLSNDSVSKIEGVVLDTLNKMDIQKSKVAIQNYANFMSAQKYFNFKLIVNSGNANHLNLANAFYNELKKLKPTIYAKVIIEETVNSKYTEGIYLKAVFQKNKKAK